MEKQPHPRQRETGKHGSSWSLGEEGSSVFKLRKEVASRTGQGCDRGNGGKVM